MNRTGLLFRLASSGSRWSIVTAVVTLASSNHFSTWDSMMATMRKLRRKNSCSLKPYSVSSQPMLVMKPRYPPGVSRWGCMGEEVGIDVRPPCQGLLSRPFSPEQIGIVGLVYGVDVFLPDVRRVANCGVDLAKGDTALRVPSEGNVVQGNAGLGVKEAGSSYPWVVALVAQVTDREVDGGELGRERPNVHAEYLVKQLLMGDWGIRSDSS